MYAQFTDRARKVMQLATQEAHRFNHEYIGTEHILLGLVKEGTGVAAQILKSLDIDLRKIRLEVEKIVLPGPDPINMATLPQTPRAKKVIEYAIEESRSLGHNYVGSEHVLLGLLREGEGVAAQVLMNLGLSLNGVREEVLGLLGYSQVFEEAGNRDVAKPAEDPSVETMHLPESAREIVAEFDCQIDVIQEEKEEAVAAQEWEKAAELRDLAHKLKKLRADFISHWPPTQS